MKLVAGGPECVLPVLLLLCVFGADVVAVKISPDSLALSTKSDESTEDGGFSLQLVEPGDDFQHAKGKVVQPEKSSEPAHTVAAASEKATSKSIRGAKSDAAAATKVEVAATSAKSDAAATKKVEVAATSAKSDAAAAKKVEVAATSNATSKAQVVECPTVEVKDVYCDVTGSAFVTDKTNKFGADYSFEVKGQCDAKCKATPGCASWVFTEARGCFLSKEVPDWRICPSQENSHFGRVPCAKTTTTTTLLPGSFMWSEGKWCYPGNSRITEGKNFKPNLVGGDENCCAGDPGKCQKLCETHPECKMFAYSKVGACYLGKENMDVANCPAVFGAYAGNRKTMPYEACDSWHIKDNRWCYPWNHIKTGVAGFSANAIGGDFECCKGRPDLCHAMCLKAGPKCVSWSYSETGGCFLAENLPDQTNCPQKNQTWFGVRSCMTTTTTSTPATPLADCGFSVQVEKDCFMHGSKLIREQKVLASGHILGTGFSETGADMGCCKNNPGKCMALCKEYPGCVAWKLKEGIGCFLSTQLPSSECMYDLKTYVGQKRCPQRETLREVVYKK